MKFPVQNTAFHSPEINNKIKLIRLMAVCMEHIICDTLITLLIFDFLNVIRKLRHIFYCDVRFYYDMSSSTRAITPCYVNISHHMPVNRNQWAVVVAIVW